MTIAAVIPAFNEAATIASVARLALENDIQVIIVDDGSTDSTTEVLNNLPICVERHSNNQGKAAALWTGIRRALAVGAEAVITLDGDGQHNPADIDALINASYKYPDAVIIAARHLGREKAPMIRVIANRIADFWVGWAAGRRLYDSQSGFRLYPRALLENLSIPTHSGRNFVFESEILIEASWLGYDCVVVPIQSVYPIDARASHYKPLQDTGAIIVMVAGRLWRKAFSPYGLMRSLRERIRWAGDP